MRKANKNPQFAPIDDGLLYVEVPTFESLQNLLLNQRWRNRAHLRTSCGYVPYFGGGIAFKAWNLIAKGVKPLWREAPGESPEEALSRIVKTTGFFEDENEALEHHAHCYKKECEWRGPAGMEFSNSDIAFVWLGPTTVRKIGAKEAKAQLRLFLPSRIPIREEAPEKQPFPFK